MIFSVIGHRDINATTALGETLLHAACTGGQHSLVKSLLEFNDIHLNTKLSGGVTPLMLAARNGHLECVRQVLATNVQCKLDTAACNIDSETALSLAAKNNHWDVVKVIWDALPCKEEVILLKTLISAVKARQWEVFQNICGERILLNTNSWMKIFDEAVKTEDWKGVAVALRRCNNIFAVKETLAKVVHARKYDGLKKITGQCHFDDQVYDNVLDRLVAEQCWEGINILLSKHKFDTQSLLYTLSKSVKKEQWLGVEIFLTSISKRAKLNIELVETIIKSSQEEIKNRLITGNYDHDTLNGTLLVISCYGVSEQVINLLLDHFHDYDYEILDNVLIISVLRKLLTILSPLLNHHLHTFTYDVLCKALHLAKNLRHKDVEKMLSAAVDEHAKAICLSQSVHNEGRGIGQGSGVASPFTEQKRQAGPLQLTVRRIAQPVPVNSDTYDTTTDPRGIILILNYQKFQGRIDLQREGSQFDVINLMSLFGQMGYETQVHWDLTEDQTLSIIAAFREQERMRNAGCSVVFIMSHGIARQTFHTSDMQCVTVDKVKSMFLDGECPYLKGKPKLFFFNFCRGADEPQMTVQSDAVLEVPRDMLFIFSAPEGFRSYRHAERGTPFVLSLCQVLSENAHDHSLDDLLRKFKKTYSTTNYGTTPDIQDLNFAKKFYFNPRL
ncbi:hypothetical protein SK128_005728 [Halocaridina rubra]|uniref:Caspase n=1 Tax=Halocaridina rubra TaxID=373956 RepID=A0AAN8X9S1_HALRR